MNFLKEKFYTDLRQLLHHFLYQNNLPAGLLKEHLNSNFRKNLKFETTWNFLY